MKKRYLALIIVLIVLAVFLLLFGETLLNVLIPGTFEKSIVRNTQGAEQERTLSAAENFNYTDVFKIERFDGSTDPEDYLNPKTYLMYTYAHCIDSEVLKYYDTRSEDLKGNPDIEFTYEANVYEWDWFNVAYLDDDTILVLSPDGTVLYENPEYTGPYNGMRFVIANNSDYSEIQPEELNITFSNCFLVEMKLWYSETYAPVAGYGSGVYQVVIADEHFKPVLIWLETEGYIS